MASKRSKTDTAPDWTGPRIDFASFAVEIAQRRAALGPDFTIPRNAGNNRTVSKQALLKAITAAGGKW